MAALRRLVTARRLGLPGFCLTAMAQPERRREAFEQQGADCRPELDGLSVGLRLVHEDQQVQLVGLDPSEAEVGPSWLRCDQIRHRPDDRRLEGPLVTRRFGDCPKDERQMARPVATS